jgi:hypothetical protein
MFSLTNGMNVLDVSLSDALLPVIASFGAAVEYLDICGMLSTDVDKGPSGCSHGACVP